MLLSVWAGRAQGKVCLLWFVVDAAAKLRARALKECVWCVLWLPHSLAGRDSVWPAQQGSKWSGASGSSAVAHPVVGSIEPPSAFCIFA